MQTRNILLIEDDISICDIVSHHLLENGFQVHCVHDGNLGLQEALSGKYNLVILDLSLPLLSGIDICKAVRKQFEFLPLIMLTARDSVTDRVVGLEIGADDYIIKPFDIHELMARVRTRLRLSASSDRAGNCPSSEDEELCLSCGALNLYPDSRRATISGLALETTAKEFDVLEYLLTHRKRVVSREELLHNVWGSTVAAYEETVTSLISRLRKKMEGVSPEGNLIQTIRGVGFRIIEPTAQSDTRCVDDE